MKLLFKHSQTPGRFRKVQFKLWGQIEFEGDEHEIVDKYDLDDAILIAAIQPTLIRNAAILALLVAAVAYATMQNFGLAIIVGAGVGYYFYHQKRETVYVKDLIHGRYFSCNSIIDQAKREQWLRDTVATLRQVMEAARHWDGTEAIDIPVLDKETARRLVARL